VHGLRRREGSGGLGKLWPEGRILRRELGLGFGLSFELGLRAVGLLLQGVEQLLLGCGDGLGVAHGDLGCGTGLLRGSLGLGGKDRMVAGRVGVALGNGGCDAG
jgi:hypothetical protein